MTPSRRSLLTAVGAAAIAPAALRAATPPVPPTPPWTSHGDVIRGGGRLRYATMEGTNGAVSTRPPLVLLPKVGGWIQDWSRAAPFLAAERRVIAIDPPGHGGSTMLGPPPFAQTLPESAASILAALDELGVDRFAIAGNSLGGCIGVVMAALYPGRVEKLALVSVSLPTASTRAQLLATEAAAPPGEFTQDGHPLPRLDGAVARFGTMDPSVIAEQEASRAVCDRWLRPSERGVALGGVAEHLPAIQAPTLLIYADRGFYLRYEAIGRRAIRTVQVAHIVGAGSFVHQEKPAETAALLLPFLNG